MESQFDAITNPLRRRLKRGRNRLDDLQRGVAYQTRRAGRRADYYVHENSWKTMAAAVAAGVLIGLLIPRR